MENHTSWHRSCSDYVGCLFFPGWAGSAAPESEYWELSMGSRSRDPFFFAMRLVPPHSPKWRAALVAGHLHVLQLRGKGCDCGEIMACPDFPLGE